MLILHGVSRWQRRHRRPVLLMYIYRRAHKMGAEKKESRVTLAWQTADSRLCSWLLAIFTRRISRVDGASVTRFMRHPCVLLVHYTCNIRGIDYIFQCLEKSMAQSVSPSCTWDSTRVCSFIMGISKNAPQDALEIFNSFNFIINYLNTQFEYCMYYCVFIIFYLLFILLLFVLFI